MLDTVGLSDCKFDRYCEKNEKSISFYFILKSRNETSISISYHELTISWMKSSVSVKNWVTNSAILSGSDVRGIVKPIIEIVTIAILGM